MKIRKTIGWKLFKKRSDGTLGPLFINTKQRIPIGQWISAEEHLTKGFTFRPGWHACPTRFAPHLSEKGRVWKRVELLYVDVIDRPKNLGGKWFLAKKMKVL